MSTIDLERKSLPHEPGVYFFLNNIKTIIYIGKAINLKKRVNQYFVKTNYNDPFYEQKIKELVRNIHSVEYIVTENEKEAKILENIQIKKHMPRFNVAMRDSKTYPWFGIFYSEKFPRIRIIRGPEKYSKDNQFLGPFTDKKEITRILRDLRKIFPYCSCKKRVKKQKTPCLYYQLKLCPGACIDAITEEDYMLNVKQIEMFLKGQTDELKKQINGKMKGAAQIQNFEIAAFWRDKLQAIDNSTTSQNVLLDRKENKDIVGYYKDEGQKYIAMVIIHIREGRISNKSSYPISIEDKIIQNKDIFPSILEQFYQDLTHILPDVIVIPDIYEGINLFKEILTEHKIGLKIRLPLEEEYGLLRIANKNAKVMVDQEILMEKIKKNEENQIQKALEEAKKILNLPKIPRVIEGFDISNIEGTDATGSMVYFLEGRPYNKYYRHFNIRSKSTPDDVAMMKEVIMRRYTMLIENNFTLPDLILVDGGKGQLNAGYSVLKELGIEGIPIIGLAKKFEEIFVPNEKNPIILPKNSSSLKLFQRVRDEAHRFSKRLHKKQRERRITGSVLDTFKGVGPATRNKLLKHFGSVEGIKKASYEELTKVIGKKLAETIILNLKKNYKER